MAESEKAGEGRGLAIVLMGQAQSLQRVAETLQPDVELDVPGSALYRGKTVVVPMLLGLATELALKAWQCESRKGPYDRSHDLVDLFDSLDEDTKSRLEGALPAMRLVAKLSPERAMMREILLFHRDAFERWRYTHEVVRVAAETGALNAALETLIGVFCQEVKQTQWYAGIETDNVAGL